MSTYNGLVTSEQAVEAQWGAGAERLSAAGGPDPQPGGERQGRRQLRAGDADRRWSRRAAAWARSAPRRRRRSSTIPQKFQQFQQAQDGLSSALSRLMVVVERYPELQAVQAFRDLMVQLEGTENRIAVERRPFNEVAQDYNTRVRKFPAALFAGMFGFQPKPYFQAQPGAETAPKVDFGGATPPAPAPTPGPPRAGSGAHAESQDTAGLYPSPGDSGLR